MRLRLRVLVVPYLKEGGGFTIQFLAKKEKEDLILILLDILQSHRDDYFVQYDRRCLMSTRRYFVRFFTYLQHVPFSALANLMNES